MANAPLRVDDTRGLAQGELFLMRESGSNYEALVYNTTGFGPCPAAAFAAIDVGALTEQTGTDLVWKNPRRFWMMDALTISIIGEPRVLGGVTFNLVAKMQMPAGFDPRFDQSAMAYRPTQIRRVSTYVFSGGRPVFLLRSPEEVTWVLQTYTNHLSELTEADLLTMGSRLALPDGWRYRAATPAQDLVIATDGLANIVSDDFANMYQGCVGEVASFDPWS